MLNRMKILIFLIISLYINPAAYGTSSAQKESPNPFASPQQTAETVNAELQAFRTKAEAVRTELHDLISNFEKNDEATNRRKRLSIDSMLNSLRESAKREKEMFKAFREYKSQATGSPNHILTIEEMKIFTQKSNDLKPNNLKESLHKGDGSPPIISITSKTTISQNPPGAEKLLNGFQMPKTLNHLGDGTSINYLLGSKSSNSPFSTNGLVMSSEAPSGNKNLVCNDQQLEAHHQLQGQEKDAKKFPDLPKSDHLNPSFAQQSSSDDLKDLKTFDILKLNHEFRSNNLSHEANYKLSRQEQEEEAQKNRYLPISMGRRSAPFNPMNEIELKTSKRLMNRGLGASLPSYSLSESRKEAILDKMIKRLELEMNKANENAMYDDEITNNFIDDDVGPANTFDLGSRSKKKVSVPERNHFKDQRHEENSKDPSNHFTRQESAELYQSSKLIDPNHDQSAKVQPNRFTRHEGLESHFHSSKRTDNNHDKSNTDQNDRFMRKGTDEPFQSSKQLDPNHDQSAKGQHNRFMEHEEIESPFQSSKLTDPKHNQNAKGQHNRFMEHEEIESTFQSSKLTDLKHNQNAKGQPNRFMRQGEIGHSQASKLIDPNHDQSAKGQSNRFMGHEGMESHFQPSKLTDTNHHQSPIDQNDRFMRSGTEESFQSFKVIDPNHDQNAKDQPNRFMGHEGIESLFQPSKVIDTNHHQSPIDQNDRFMRRRTEEPFQSSKLIDPNHDQSAKDQPNRFMGHEGTESPFQSSKLTDPNHNQNAKDQPNRFMRQEEIGHHQASKLIDPNRDQSANGQPDRFLGHEGIESPFHSSKLTDPNHDQNSKGENNRFMRQRGAPFQSSKLIYANRDQSSKDQNNHFMRQGELGPFQSSKLIDANHDQSTKDLNNRFMRQGNAEPFEPSKLNDLSHDQSSKDRTNRFMREGVGPPFHSSKLMYSNQGQSSNELSNRFLRQGGLTPVQSSKLIDANLDQSTKDLINDFLAQGGVRPHFHSSTLIDKNQDQSSKDINNRFDRQSAVEHLQFTNPFDPNYDQTKKEVNHRFMRQRAVGPYQPSKLIHNINDQTLSNHFMGEGVVEPFQSSKLIDPNHDQSSKDLNDLFMRHGGVGSFQSSNPIGRNHDQSSNDLNDRFIRHGGAETFQPSKLLNSKAFTEDISEENEDLSYDSNNEQQKSESFSHFQLPTPKANLPEGRLQDTNLPGGNHQYAKCPKSSDLDCDVPECKLPDCKIPECKIPECKIPECKIPDCKVPDCKIPDCKLPDCNLPDSNLPEVNPPGMNVEKLEGIGTKEIQIAKAGNPPANSNSPPHVAIEPIKACENEGKENPSDKNIHGGTLNDPSHNAEDIYRFNRHLQNLNRNYPSGKEQMYPAANTLSNEGSNFFYHTPPAHLYESRMDQCSKQGSFPNQNMYNDRNPFKEIQYNFPSGAEPHNSHLNRAPLISTIYEDRNFGKENFPSDFQTSDKDQTHVQCKRSVKAAGESSDNNSENPRIRRRFKVQDIINDVINDLPRFNHFQNTFDAKRETLTPEMTAFERNPLQLNGYLTKDGDHLIKSAASRNSRLKHRRHLPSKFPFHSHHVPLQCQQLFPFRERRKCYNNGQCLSYPEQRNYRDLPLTLGHGLPQNDRIKRNADLETLELLRSKEGNGDKAREAEGQLNLDRSIEEVLTGRVSSKIVETVLDKVKNDPDLKDLYPSLGKNRPLAKQMKLFCNHRNEEIDNEMHKTEQMLRKAMDNINDIIEEQVRSRSCIPLRPDLSQFYELILKTYSDMDKGSNQNRSYNYALLHDPDIEKFSPQSIDEQSHLLKDLLQQFENLSEENKMKAYPLRDDLLKDLDFVHQIRNEQQRLKREKLFEFRPIPTDAADNDLVLLMKAKGWSPAYLNLRKTSELFRDAAPDKP